MLIYSCLIVCGMVNLFYLYRTLGVLHCNGVICRDIFFNSSHMQDKFVLFLSLKITCFVLFFNHHVKLRTAVVADNIKTFTGTS